MTKLKFILIVGTIVISLAVALILQWNAQVKLRENEAVLRQQNQQVTELIVEQERLSNRVAEVKSPTNSQLSELARLRSRAQELQKQTNELGAQLKSNRPARAARPESVPAPRPAEYYDELRRTVGAKPIDARNLTTAFALYASDNQGRFPSSFEQVATYLRDFPLSGTNQFDIVYRGSLDDLKGIPRGAVAVIRDQQTWIAPNGKKGRVYGLANGASEIVFSDDDFKAWEDEHIISSVPTGQ